MNPFVPKYVPGGSAHLNSESPAKSAIRRDQVFRFPDADPDQGCNGQKQKEVHYSPLLKDPHHGQRGSSGQPGTSSLRDHHGEKTNERASYGSPLLFGV